MGSPDKRGIGGIMNKKAIIAISGGVDSAVVTAIVEAEGYDLYFLTVNYGQKSFKREEDSTKELSKYYKAKEHKIIDMKWLGELGHSVITSKEIQLEGNSDDIVYVPYRNTLIIAAAVAWAEVIGAEKIYTGSDAPYNGHVSLVPDNNPLYYRQVNNLVAISTKLNKNILVVAPLNHCNKDEIVKKGFELGVPFELTWTCVLNNEKACGVCPPCKDRLRAFAKNNITDQIQYVGK